MESLPAPVGFTRFAELVGRSLAGGQFTLIDIGCSGGIDPQWRGFGPQLRAVGFTPDAGECMRLTEFERLKSVHYVGSALAADPAFMAARGDRPAVTRDPRQRLLNSVPPRAQERACPDSTEIKIQLPKYFEGDGIDDIDFIKASANGADLGIVSSLTQSLDDCRVLGVEIEVNFYGSGNATENSFHNIDRTMRDQGFALFDLAIRRSPACVLPDVWDSGPQPANIGRACDGHALYVRDLCAPDMKEFAADLPAAKKAKVAAIFSLFGQPDSAAEILETFKDEMTGFFDVAEALESLSAQAQHGRIVVAHPAGDALPVSLATPQPDAALAEERRRHDEALAGETERLKQEIAQLRSSTSWKITGPLRRVIRVMRRSSSRRAA